MITLTALAPPPSGNAVCRKYGEIESNGRVRIRNVIHARPRPTAPAIAMCAVRRAIERSAGLCCGSQSSASMIRITVAISTSSCVSARSGADR